MASTLETTAYVQDSPLTRRPAPGLSAAAVAAFDEYVALSPPECLDIWKSLPPPDFEELSGEFSGHLLPNFNERYHGRQTAGLANIDGPNGLWLGKAFVPHCSVSGEGYNVFLRPDGRVERRVGFGTIIGCSRIDGRLSFLMHYSSFHRTIAAPQDPLGKPAWHRDVIDEMRKLADGVYVGAASSKAQTLAEPGREDALALQQDYGFELPENITFNDRSNPVLGLFVLTGPIERAPGVDDPASEDR
jgi:hypothetical protein